MLTWAALLIASVLLSVAARARDRLTGDLWLMRQVQDLPAFALPSEAVRAVTSTEVVLVLGAGLALGLFLLKRRVEAIAFAAGLAVLPFLQSGIKSLADRPRPTAELVDLRSGFTSPSFPSGHVMSGTYLLLGAAWAVLLLLPYPSRLAHVLLALCALVFALNLVANVYEGVHWPSDVLGGVLWALVLFMPVPGGAAALRRRLARR